MRATNRLRRNVTSGSADFGRQDFLNREQHEEWHTRVFTHLGLLCVNGVKDFLTRESGCHTLVFQLALNATDILLADDV
ncbi:hypothetical protein [Paraburkholderia fynbosensis]|uniref:hypothetical protein n=1 Tax=Paraburkholderia fynbosensis TaxID=1200993 RepID=UPI001C2F0663|nr:hypothetical protein [Paraburkholderia fynbosensis]